MHRPAASVVRRTGSTVAAATVLSLGALMSCASESAVDPSGGRSTSTARSSRSHADASVVSPASSQVRTGHSARISSGSNGDDPCADLSATARIVDRDPDQSWTVTRLEGEISNPSTHDADVSAVHLQFKPGIPPDVYTAELTVPLDVTIPAGSMVPWEWTGSLLVRPFHDDAPQPEVNDIDWIWINAGTSPPCGP